MTLPSSGPLSLTDIQAEFGGPTPIALNNYYAGGSYVPAGISGTYGPVPSSGEIGIQNFYGTTKGYSSFTVTKGSGSDYYGYNIQSGSVPVIGSISPYPSPVSVFSGKTLLGIYDYYKSSPFSSILFSYMIVSGNITGDSWNQVYVSGTPYSAAYTKAAASYITFDSGSNTTTVFWLSGYGIFVTDTSPTYSLTFS